MKRGCPPKFPTLREHNSACNSHTRDYSFALVGLIFLVNHVDIQVNRSLTEMQGFCSAVLHNDEIEFSYQCDTKIDCLLVPR